jgi:hypothetical protein
MVGHVLELAASERRELLSLLTQERADLQTDDEVLAELSETLRRQLSLGAATDLAEGFRRRMIRVAEELRTPVALGGEDRGPGHYDFLTDRAIAEDILKMVKLRAQALSSGGDGDFMADFAKSFTTMSLERRATWLREAALAASATKSEEAAARHAAEAAKHKASAESTAERIAHDVADLTHDVMRKKGAGGAVSTGAAVLGLVAGGAVAYAIRDRRQARKNAAKVVQVRRERQATQSVVTTCAFVIAALDSA